MKRDPQLTEHQLTTMEAKIDARARPLKLKVISGNLPIPARGPRLRAFVNRGWVMAVKYEVVSSRW
jgi:hypothetical protein